MTAAGAGANLSARPLTPTSATQSEHRRQLTQQEQQELIAARAIAAWNAAHGAVLSNITEARGAVSDACSQAIAAPSKANYAAVRTAGAKLEKVGSAALHGPWAG